MPRPPGNPKKPKKKDIMPVPVLGYPKKPLFDDTTWNTTWSLAGACSIAYAFNEGSGASSKNWVYNGTHFGKTAGVPGTEDRNWKWLDRGAGATHCWCLTTRPDGDADASNAANFSFNTTASDTIGTGDARTHILWFRCDDAGNASGDGYIWYPNAGALPQFLQRTAATRQLDYFVNPDTIVVGSTMSGAVYCMVITANTGTSNNALVYLNGDTTRTSTRKWTCNSGVQNAWGPGGVANGNGPQMDLIAFFQMRKYLTKDEVDQHIAKPMLAFGMTYGFGGIPTDVVCTATDAANVLGWTGAAGASHYNVYEALVTGGPYTLVGTAFSLSFVRSGLNNGITYFYTLKGTDGTEGPVSAEVLGTPYMVSPDNTLTLQPHFPMGFGDFYSRSSKPSPDLYAWLDGAN